MGSGRRELRPSNIAFLRLNVRQGKRPLWAGSSLGERPVLLFRHKFDHGLPMIGLLVGIAIFAIAGNLLWKAANRYDPARESDKSKFFFQNQLGAIITLIAFVPLVFLILNDKDLDPQSKKVAGGVGAVLAVVATLIGVSYIKTAPSVSPLHQI